MISWGVHILVTVLSVILLASNLGTFLLIKSSVNLLKRSGNFTYHQV
jgi:hypothetical protein